MGERREGPADRQAIDAQASAFAARLQGDISATERREIQDWIAADPRHAVAYARIEAAWEAAERLRADPPAVGEPAPASTDDPVAKLLARRDLVAGLAGVAVLGVAATAAWRYADDVQLYRTQVGERRVVVLADGSQVRLNTGSTVEVALTRHKRRVRLVTGEALFEVAHDKARPFIVEAGSARLRAVGTQFNVRIRENVVELTVTEGVVAVTQRGEAGHKVEAPHIVAGDGAVIRAGAVAPTRLDEEVLRQRTAWQDGVIELDGDTLASAVDEFNRYRAQPIIVGDARLADIRVGGRFEVDEADKFLVALESSFPIRAISSQDGSVLLVARP